MKDTYEICPECGRKVKKENVRHYTTGEKMYIHKTKKGMFGIREIIDGCFIPKPKPAKP